MKTPAPALASLCLALAACGARGAKSGDAGAPEANATGRRSFDVVAKVTATSATSAEVFPATNAFTLELDPAAGRAIAGGGGEAAAVALASDDGRTFHISTAIGVGVSRKACAGLLRLAYETVDFTVTGGTFAGRATGHGFFASPNGTPTVMAFEATLEGTPDTTPPYLIGPAGGTATDPLAAFDVWTSEPLPPSALARLVGGDGDVAGLVPEVLEGEVPLIAHFSKPSLTLPPATSFDALFSDDVTDLAGNVAPLGVGVRLLSFDAAPLVAPDGFESAKELVVSGATLVVRLAAPSGATKVRFAYRVVASPSADTTDVGTVQIGSVGRAPGLATPIPMTTIDQKVTWKTQTFDASPITLMEVPLPEATGPELIVAIRARASCDPAASGSPALLIDGLRLE